MELTSHAEAAQSLSPMIVAALIVGVPLMLKFGADFFGWSVSRNVAHEDKAKTKMEAKQEEHATKLIEHDRALERLSTEHSNHKDNITGQLGQMNGRLQQLDTRIAESNKDTERRFKDGLQDLGVELNRKLSNIVTNEVPELLRQQLQAEEERRVRTRKKR